MENVTAIACDMNSDFDEDFTEKYPHIKILFDYFHIVKNFNDKVINEIRKEEQVRLANEGDVEEYKLLKNSKYILTSSRETLKKKNTQTEKKAETTHLFKETIDKYKNKHFIWFGKLIVNHIDEIITHAKYKISSGKIEEINNKIKTLRRQAYDYPDNEYFFLKLFDITRNQIISHKNND